MQKDDKCNPMTEKTFNYQKALAEIEHIVQQIESGEPDIDELSSLVKKAAELIKSCKSKLRDTGAELEKIVQDLENH